MAKRGPQSSLNHLNWNETDEPEEKGEFAKASDDVLKQRVIKKARRRVATDAADSTAPAASTSVFGAFKGFASTPLAKSGADKLDGTTPTFSFLSTLGAAAKTNGNGTATVSSSAADSGGVAGSTKPMFSFGSNQGTIGAADANKKMFTFGSPNALKADSTESAKNASSTSSGFGISSSKESDKEGAGKGLFSFAGATAAANPSNAGSAPTFSFSSVPPSKTTDSSKPEKNFTFGFAGSNKDSDTTPKPKFSFGSVAAKTDSGEAEKSIGFGSPIAAKDSSLSAASSTGMFNFGSNATKTDANDTEKKTFGSFGSAPGATKSTFSFGSPATKTDSSEPERKGFAFGSSPAASKDPAAAVPTKGIFAFGSPAAKPAAASETPEKATVTFGSPASSGTKDTSTTTPKGTFSFGSLAPKSNADEGADKKATFSFESAPAFGAKTTSAQNTPKPTFSFGSLQPAKGDTVSFGATAPPTKKASEAETKTFSFGIPHASNEAADKSKASFATPKENSQDTIKKMFSFAPAPKVDSDKKEEEKKSVSFPLTTTKPTTSSGTAQTGTKILMKTYVIALNRAFVGWITEKYKENAFCDFRPVFESYEKHMATIQEAEQNGTEKSGMTNSRPDAAKLTSQPAKMDFPIEPVTAAKPLETKPTDPVSKEPEKAKEKTGFFFGTSAPKESATMKTLAAAPTTAGFTFGSGKPLTFGGFSSSTSNSATPANTTTANNASTVSTTSPSFFAGASTFASKSLTPGGFTFGSVVKPPVPDSSAAEVSKDAGGDGGGEADEDEPPKVEFTPVEEKDSLYSKRCKLYVKVNGSYSDRGIGTLHVKKVDSKVQLILRADTSLGNILLNIILNESVPVQRLGTNNVMMICLPTPESKPPPTSVLLRVKTSEEADEMFENLLKFKPK